MKYKHFIIYSIVIFITIIILPFLIVFAMFGNDLAFQPDKFINDIFGFLISILSFTFTFIFTNIYWIKQNKRNETIDYFNKFSLIIGRLKKEISNISDLLDKDKHSQDEVIENDIKIQNKMKCLENNIIILDFIFEHIYLTELYTDYFFKIEEKYNYLKNELDELKITNKEHVVEDLKNKKLVCINMLLMDILELLNEGKYGLY
jgi:hypothetical protein